MDRSFPDNITHVPVDMSGVISYDVLYWTIMIGAVGVSGSIGMLGIVANIINIIVFIRQGILGDSSTVSLFCLSISDLMCEVTMMWLAVCYALWFGKVPGLPYDPLSMLYLTAGRPHVMFTQMTRWITAFITFERCMCVLFPFKVKTLFSPFKTAAAVSFICAFTFLVSYLPLYVNQYLRWRRHPATNKSMLMLYETESYASVGVIGFFNAYVCQTLALLSVFVFTQTTAIRLNLSRKWRKSTASSTGVDTPKQPGMSTKSESDIGTKDKRLVKMIRVISIIFLICYTPEFMIIVAEKAKPSISPGGRYYKLFFFLYTFSFIFEAFNSSVNIIVYYTMSTRYRNEFQKLFGRTEQKK